MNSNSRIAGSIIICLAGLLLFLDRIVKIELSNNFGYNNTSSFLWTFGQVLSTLFLVVGFSLKPFRIAYAIPSYMSILQLIFLFSDLTVDDNLAYIYCLGITFLFMLIFVQILKHIKDEKKKDEKISFLEKMLDLSYAIAEKRNEK